MLPLLLANWRIVTVGLLVAAVAGYVWHCQRLQSQWAEARAAGQRQEAENARQALRDLRNKERSDENYQRNLSRLRADVKRLRNARTGILPAASASAGSPDAARICFDREQLNLALQRFTSRIEGLVTEGDAAMIGLDEARAWASGR